jgi:hypothetical protein
MAERRRSIRLIGGERRWGGRSRRSPMRWRTQFGGWCMKGLTGHRSSTSAKLGDGGSTSVERRAGGWCRWLGRRAPGHHGGARGRAGGTGRRLEQTVLIEALGGSGAEENRRRRCCTATVGVEGWAVEVAGAHAGTEEASTGRLGSESASRRWRAWWTWRWLFMVSLLHEALKPARERGGGGARGAGAVV